MAIHSMDAGALKNSDFQTYLAELAEVKGLSTIISVDHIKSPIMWSEQMVDKDNFVCIEMNTFEGFDIELEYQSTLFTFKNDNQEVGLAFVFKSMTSHQKGIIKLIA